MIRILLLLILLLCSFTGYARDIYVLSVGISDYKYIKDLKKTETDAQDFADLYKTHTKNVKVLLGAEATHDNIIHTLSSYFSQAQEDDIVVFFFSGHGGKGGLCAYDTKSDNTLVTYAEVQKTIRNCKASNKQLFIDACFSGGLRADTKSATKAENTHSSLSTTQGVMLFLSSRTGETSQENLWSNNGFFTQYLIKGIKGGADANKDRIITAKEIFIYVKKNVSERTKKKQNPVMWGYFDDDMHIMNWNHKK